MMDFIRDMLPFIYNVSEEKLVIGTIVAIFVLGLIVGDASTGLGFLITSAIVYALAYYFLDGFMFTDAFAVIILCLIILITISIVIAVLNKIKKDKEEKAEQAKKEAEEKAFYTCESCGEEDALEYVNTTEEDRYIANKEVTEKTAKGNYKTRNVKITKVVEKTHYKCKFCGAEYTTKNTRELRQALSLRIVL